MRTTTAAATTLLSAALLGASLLSGAVEYTFTPIEAPPGASQLTVAGINDVGQTVGSYVDSTQRLHTFIYTAAGFTEILAGSPAAINDLGQIVGQGGISGVPPVQRAYLREPDGTIIDLPVLGRTNFATSINNLGQIVGYRQNPPISPGLGYLYSGGSLTTIHVANADGTRPYGINNAGYIVGTYYDLAGDRPHGFLYQNGIFSTLDVPGADVTFARGINDAGDIVGHFEIYGVGTHGFLYKNGGFSQVDVAGASSTLVLAINDNGQIVGIHSDAAGWHGFLGDPAPPFAGRRGEASCHAVSVAALARQYGGLKSAVTALKLSSVAVLHRDVRQFCGTY